jgi:hypothetical protein
MDGFVARMLTLIFFCFLLSSPPLFRCGVLLVAFQPITGTCAEKHDTFLDTLRDGETPLVRFTGKQLIMGEVRRMPYE